MDPAEFTPTSPAGARRQTTEPGAFAIVRSDPPRLFLAEDAAVISRVIALKVVAAEDPANFGAGVGDAMRDALLQQRWADAVLLWMSDTDTDIDVFPEYVQVWTEAELDDEMASLEIRMSPLFTGLAGPEADSGRQRLSTPRSAQNMAAPAPQERSA